MRTFAIVWVVLVGAAVSACGQIHPCSAGQSAATKAKSTQSRLLKVKSDWMGLDVSLPEHSEDILRLKDEVVRVADAEVACKSSNSLDIDAADLERSIASILGANKPEAAVKPITGLEPDTVDGVLGASLRVAVKQPEGFATLITVEARFGIECGYDTVLLVYERSASRWRQVIRWQRGRYDTPGDAFGDFFTYAVLPGSDHMGGWRMVVAHGLPWCTSRFSAFEIDLLQPRYGEMEQRTIWHYKEGYSRFDTDPHLEITRDGFQLRLPFIPVDPNIYTRPGVFRFHVEGDRVERVQPVATNGRDFVNVWLEIGWNDAERWSDATNLADLKMLHQGFAARYNDTKDPTTYSYGPVLACSDTKHFQVRIDADPGGPTFYQIRQKQNGFIMMLASAIADARCGGHDLMSKQ